MSGSTLVCVQPVDLVDGSTGIGDLAHDEGLVLLNLVLHLVDLLNLLGHLSNGVLVLLLEADKSGLLLDVGLLELAAELGHLSLTLLVQLNLGRGGSSGLSEALSHVLKTASQVGPLALGLGASLPLGLQLLLELLDMGLVLLDALLDLGNQALLLIKLASFFLHSMAVDSSSFMTPLLVALHNEKLEHLGVGSAGRGSKAGNRAESLYFNTWSLSQVFLLQNIFLTS